MINKDQNISTNKLDELKLISTKNVIEQLLNSKIGYGQAQQSLASAIYILVFTQGCESIVLGLLLPQLQTQWNISVFEKSLLLTIVYAGVAIGSYLQTYSDKYGRYVFITWNTIIQIIFGLLSCISSSMPQFIVYRFFYGIGIGITMPLSATYISEICPQSHRGSIVLKTKIYWAIGMLFTCVLAWIWLQTHRWRLLLFIICLPAIYALIEHLRFGKQTLRYLWVTYQKQKIIQLVNLMIELNKREKIDQNQLQMIVGQCNNNNLLQLSQKEVFQLKNSFLLDGKIQNSNQLSQLFNQKYFKISCILILGWFGNCFLYYATVLFLPSILARSVTMSYDFKYAFLIIVTLIQVIALKLSPFLMDNPLTGRKKSIYIGFYGISIIFLFILLTGEDHNIALLVLFSLIKFILNFSTIIIYPYTAQIYETLLRGKAMGFFSIWCRIATVMLGLIGTNSLSWLNGCGFYLICLLLSTITGFGISRMPYCTFGRSME